MNLFWLKMLVGGLAALMLLAMLVIVGRIGYLAFGRSEAPPASEAQQIALPKGANVDSIEIDGSRLGVLARNPDGSVAIGIFDIESGALVRRFETKPAQ